MNQYIPEPVACLTPAHPGGWFDGLAGERMRIRVDSQTIGGRVSVIESIAAPMSGPPLHRHPQDEVFLVMEGSLTFQCGSERVVAAAGTVVVARAGIVHAWFNFGPLPARMMVSFTPGGVEEVFLNLAGVPFAELGAYAARHGMEVLGPPLAPLE
jgi:quercetin dioxygenase-like cupin family protein